MLPVHTNGPLTILPQYVEQCFGVPYSASIGGMACLYSQVTFAFQYFQGIETDSEAEMSFYHKMASHIPGDIPEKGVTLDIMAKAINEGWGVQMRTERLTSKDAVRSAISKGIPVLTIVEGGEFDDFDEEGILTKHAIKHATAVEKSARCGYYLHSFTTMGIDDKMLILRDNRSSYVFSGFLKVPLKYLRKHWDKMVFVALEFQRT